eukprot:801971-Rhodomonas_salina.1
MHAAVGVERCTCENKGKLFYSDLSNASQHWSLCLREESHPCSFPASVVYVQLHSCPLREEVSCALGLSQPARPSQRRHLSWPAPSDCDGSGAD